jgi:hypothetical protein
MCLDRLGTDTQHKESATTKQRNGGFFAGLLGVWNISYLDLNVRAVLPYSQALAR